MTTRFRLALGASGALALLAMLAFVVSPMPLQAASKSVTNTIGSPGVAIKGYDPVAYFVDGGPRKGKAQFAVTHNGAQWRFSSAENKAKFEADPAKYTPVYGGYCAYGVAQGYLVKIEPDAWTIRDGKLYLNYDKSIRSRWEKKPDSYIRQADKRWPKLIR